MNKLTVFNTDIIPVYETEEGEKVVIGRELHEKLEIKTAYKDWFPRMCEYGFSEENDYCSFLSDRSDGLAGKPKTDHVISLDMAKHISMIQRTEKGFTIRQKLIELEGTISDLSPTLQILINLERQQRVQEKKLAAINNDLQEFKKDMPLLGIEESRITHAVKKKGVDCLGGKEAPAYGDKSLRGKIYSDIYGQLKREFGVSSYKAIKRNQSDKAIAIIEAYEMPYVLFEQVMEVNKQITI